jgi:RNA 3'-terminal phosphate cyclase (ATP)
MAERLEIDGSAGEGGGQVLRTSLALSVITGRPIQLRRIRAGRPKPGLAPQHLTSVMAAAKLCDAELGGATLRSTELSFAPRTVAQSGTYTFDVASIRRGGSAGATTLVLQTVLVPLALAPGPSELILKGGTHVPWSPPFEFVDHVFLPALRRAGLRAESRLEAWGFYPRGGGRINVRIAGGGAAGRPPPLRLGQGGESRHIRGCAVACNLPAHVAQRIRDRATNVLRQAGYRSEIVPRLERGVGPGAALFLLSESGHSAAGFSSLGEPGKPSEAVADEACRALLAHDATGAAVDPHLADQLLLPLALAAGASEFSTSLITQHLLTNAQVIQQFVPARIQIEGAEGGPGKVIIEGATAWSVLGRRTDKPEPPGPASSGEPS